MSDLFKWDGANVRHVLPDIYKGRITAQKKERKEWMLYYSFSPDDFDRSLGVPEITKMILQQIIPLHKGLAKALADGTIVNAEVIHCSQGFGSELFFVKALFNIEI